MSALWVLPLTVGVLGVLVIAARAHAVAGELHDSVVAFDRFRIALQPAVERVRSDVEFTGEAFHDMRSDWRTFTRR